jgi:crotonobetainyl-CoA:carnitine CoA-transferase CaiB-like acyl-CoA transferase
LIYVDDGVEFSRSPLAQFNSEVPLPAPGLGEHSTQVLASLGIDEDRIADLAAAGVVERRGTTRDALT